MVHNQPGLFHRVSTRHIVSDGETIPRHAARISQGEADAHLSCVPAGPRFPNVISKSRKPVTESMRSAKHPRYSGGTLSSTMPNDTLVSDSVLPTASAQSSCVVSKRMRSSVRLPPATTLIFASMPITKRSSANVANSETKKLPLPQRGPYAPPS